MWSHYADGHRGAVLEFKPMIKSRTATLCPHPVRYSEKVPVAATLEEYVGYVTGEMPIPYTSKGFEKSVYTKSHVWEYEREWRILDEKRTGEEGPSVLREFHPLA
jgi:hypothetical protein